MMVRQWILVLALLISFELTIAKTIEKSSRKKISSLKKRPNKTAPRLTLEAFKNLPTDDLEFIKALDKQFKLHGNNVKIKIEADNSTSKTSKRTIDNELGYGHYGGGSGYHFSAPQYMIYPYSQHDIPPLRSGYSQGPLNKYLPAPAPLQHEITEVSVDPSYAYELHPMPHSNNYGSGPHQYEGQNFVEPVIVLRLPGPSKYTSHIKDLLQQYLEIRTAQYLRMLEANEEQKYHHHSQLEHDVGTGPVYPAHYQQQSYIEADDHQNSHLGPVGYIPPIQDVYHHQKYKNKQRQQQRNQHQHHQHHQQKPQQQQQQHVSQQVQYQPEQYYQAEPVQYAEEDQPTHPGHSYQQQYIYVDKNEGKTPEMHPQYSSKPSPNSYEQVIYIQEVAMPEQEQHPHQSNAEVEDETYASYQHQNEQPSISENSPRDTHTKIVFTNEDKEDHSMMYPLPSIQPFERHPPKSIPVQHQSYQIPSNDNYNEDLHDVKYLDYQQQQSSADSVVSITQRPFNYHAHTLRMKQHVNTKRDTETPAEKFTKLNKLIDKLKARERQDN